MTYTYSYPRVAVTIDTLIIVENKGDYFILLIERANPPFQNCWALPGGYLDMEETLEEAAHRELIEETGLNVETLHELKSFSGLYRDPRERTITIVFYAIIEGICPQLNAGDDAVKAEWFPLDNLPNLAFDHFEIIEFGLNEIILKNYN
jgi:8-oxo-dGTP diphosphatase